MTKLEEEIMRAIDPLSESLPSYSKAIAELDEDNEYVIITKAAAEVAKKYISFAFDEGRKSFLISKDDIQEIKQQWLKESGVE